MPRHYDRPLPKRKPPVPSRAIRGDAPTRGMNPNEIEAAFKAGEITREEARNMMENFQRMQKANKMAKGGMVKPKKKMMGGGMTGKKAVAKKKNPKKTKWLFEFKK